MRPETPPTINSINTTFVILEQLNKVGPAGVTKIARGLDLPKSTVYNHLQTIKQNGFIVQTDDHYRLSLRFLNIGESIRLSHDLIGIAETEVDKVGEKTGLNTYLSVEEQGLGVILYRYIVDEMMIDGYRGKFVPLTISAAGKAILSGMPDNRINRIIEMHGFPKKTDNSIAGKDELLQELKEIRSKGVAFNRAEQLPGYFAVGVPISVNDSVMGAISVGGPQQVMEHRDYETDIPDILLESSNVVELNLVEDQL